MQNAGKSPPFFGFGAFEVDIRTGEVRKGARKIKLQEQPFQILAALLERPGELVTREELRQKIWPSDTFVDFDHSVNTAIAKLRHALGDDAETPRLIETLPRRGYRLIVPVDEVRARSKHAPTLRVVGVDGDPVGVQDAASVQEPRGQVSAAHRQSALRYGVGLAGGTLTAIALVLLGINLGGWRDRVLGKSSSAHIRSIAVLPLENLSGDPAQEFFADGMTDALITDLAKIGSLTVISRTSAMQYKATKKVLPQVAQELHVDAIVEGTVVRSGKRVRVDAQLIHAATDRHVWANSYERDQSDIVALQNDVARAIADEIQIKLTPQEQLRLSRARAVNPEAYEEYLQGRYLLNKQTTWETMAKAAEYFQKAIDKDPNYAAAYAGLADGYALLGYSGGRPPREVWTKAKAMAEKALAIDDNLAEAHSSLAFLLFYYNWDWPGAEREFKRAIELNPGYAWAHIWYSRYLNAMGRFDEAISEANRAQELDPLSLITNWNVAVVLFFVGQHDRALEKCQRVLEMDPNYERAHQTLGQIYLKKGLYKEAIAEIQTRAQLSKYSVWDFSLLALAHAESGDEAKARKLFAQALREKPKEGDAHEMLFARVYLALGDKEETFKWLEKAYEHRDWQLVQLQVAPPWDSVRSDPRFQDLIRRMAFPP
jgi:TolB-like protein/DNA-binding winged helix-turn-helix (wHTH) protein/Tfp pilus assembly protein PilF